MKTSQNIAAWRLLAALGEGGGFKAASIRLGLDLPACTRLVQKLEEELHLQLIERGVRPARLSETGEFLLPAARALAQSYENALNRAILYSDRDITVRLSVPVNSPRASISDFIGRYAAADPHLRIEIRSDLTHADLLEGRCDLALLPYRPDSKELLLWSAGRSFNALLASPEYLRRRGIPRAPADLAGHDLIIRSADFYPQASCLVKGEERAPLLHRRIAFAGDVLSGREAALKGEGIAVSLSIAVCRQDIESGRLVPVLPGWHRPEWEMTVATAKSQAGNFRLMNCARAFAASESRAAQQRRRENAELLARISGRPGAI